MARISFPLPSIFNQNSQNPDRLTLEALAQIEGEKQDPKILRLSAGVEIPLSIFQQLAMLAQAGKIMAVDMRLEEIKSEARKEIGSLIEGIETITAEDLSRLTKYSGFEEDGQSSTRSLNQIIDEAVQNGIPASLGQNIKTVAGFAGIDADDPSSMPKFIYMKTPDSVLDTLSAVSAGLFTDIDEEFKSQIHQNRQASRYILTHGNAAQKQAYLDINQKSSESLNRIFSDMLASLTAQDVQDFANGLKQNIEAGNLTDRLIDELNDNVDLVLMNISNGSFDQIDLDQSLEPVLEFVNTIVQTGRSTLISPEVKESFDNFFYYKSGALSELQQEVAASVSGPGLNGDGPGTPGL